MAILNLIFECFWFLLPGYLANSAPVFARKINFLDYPIDFGKKINGKRLFGAHKTFRGYFFGIIVSILTVYVQTLLMNNPFFMEHSILNYSNHNFLLLGFLFGFGALFGDSVKSHFKRKIGIKSGKSWFPFDQTDFVFGVLIFVAPVFIPSVVHMAILVVFSLLMHLTFVYIGYLLGIRKQPI